MSQGAATICAMDELTLDEQVREALVKRRGDWASVVDGAGVSHSWLSQFVRRKIDNPGYATLRKLHLFMSSDRPAQPATSVEG